MTNLDTAQEATQTLAALIGANSPELNSLLGDIQQIAINFSRYKRRPNLFARRNTMRASRALVRKLKEFNKQLMLIDKQYQPERAEKKKRKKLRKVSDEG